MKKILLLFITFLIFNFNFLYAADTDVSCINPQYATSSWSNSSQVSFMSTWTLISSTWTLMEDFYWWYVNRDNDSSIIWNYLRGYYYDNVFWFFKLDWDNNQNNNVHFVASTTKCSTWYGYKLAWFARWVQTSQSWEWWYIWFINFAYNNNIFVYYCKDDNKLHWHAYSKDLWFQSFEWISFEIITSELKISVPKNTNSFFVNDYSNIFNESTETFDSIQGDVYNMKQGKESIFYIIK